MKKAFALLLALALCSPALALASGVNLTQKQVTLSADIPSAYLYTIPDDLTIAFGASSTDLVVGLTVAVLDPGYQVTFTVSASGDLVHATDPSKTIPYTIQYNGAPLTADGVSFDDASTKALKVVIADAAWDTATSGVYSDTVTFTVAYVQIP